MGISEQELIDMGVAYAHIRSDSAMLNVTKILTTEQHTFYMNMMQHAYMNFVETTTRTHPRAWEHVWALSVALACKLGLEEH